jgi:hypothetical protein
MSRQKCRHHPHAMMHQSHFIAVERPISVASQLKYAQLPRNPHPSIEPILLGMIFEPPESRAQQAFSRTSYSFPTASIMRG